MRYAIIHEATGMVANVVEAPENYIAGRGLLAVQTDTANIGDHYEGGEFIQATSVS